MNCMDLNSTHSCDFSYHNITRSQISIDKYNGESKRINIPEKISGQEVVEIESHSWIVYLKQVTNRKKDIESYSTGG